jgi:hypothetical protein
MSKGYYEIEHGDEMEGSAKGSDGHRTMRPIFRGFQPETSNKHRESYGYLYSTESESHNQQCNHHLLSAEWATSLQDALARISLRHRRLHERLANKIVHRDAF